MLMKNHTHATKLTNTHTQTHKNVTQCHKRYYNIIVLMKYNIITIIIVHKYYYDIVLVYYIAPLYRYSVYIHIYLHIYVIYIYIYYIYNYYCMTYIL